MGATCSCGVLRVGDHGIRLHSCVCASLSPLDVVRLDRDWRICSGLVGALPGKPRQNIQLGLPFKLSSEETTLLIEKGTLIIVHIPAHQTTHVMFPTLHAFM